MLIKYIQFCKKSPDLSFKLLLSSEKISSEHMSMSISVGRQKTEFSWLILAVLFVLSAMITRYVDLASRSFPSNDFETHIILNNSMYRQPTVKKQPRKPQTSEQPQRNQSSQKPNFIQRNRELQSNKRLTEKSINQPTLPKVNTRLPPKSIPQKVEHLEKAVERLSQGTGNPELQKLLLQEIQGIKAQLREIKQQIGIAPSNEKRHAHLDADEEIEENIADMVPREDVQQPYSNRRENTQPQHIQPQHNQRIESRAIEEPQRKNQSGLHESDDGKQLVDIGKIQPYMKEFKLEGAKIPMRFYRGYHKKSSKPIIVKYCGENSSMEAVISLYEKLWKNIVKAKKVCINKVYDPNEPLATNIMALQMNKHHLEEIQIPPPAILQDVLRALQFFHQCGYLYRNLHPQHVMQSYDGNIVLLDLKLMKRYLDIKGKHMDVKGNPAEGMSQFMSNARLRGVAESRKDDLQTLGYLALYLLEGRLPWSLQNIVQVRSKCTLQQLYGNYGSLLQFMVAVHKMGPLDAPDYDHLHSLLAQ